ncbi:hypothetical protein JCM10908_007185 [Rhodotorula pacifica]|uniref:CORVET complex membrane-binding subunit VPS8 n=1 Tax=Rhodotorula pacifica TaxID=1495444 RepID=UPI0031741AB2
MSGQDRPDLDELPDWGAPTASAPAAERRQGASPPPPPHADESSNVANSYSEQLKDMLGDEDSSTHGDTAAEDDFGEFVHSGKDAAPLESKPDDDDVERGEEEASYTARLQDVVGNDQEHGGATEVPSSASAEEASPVHSSPDPPPPEAAPLANYTSALGIGRPSPLSPAGSRVTSASNDEFPALRNGRGALDRARSSYGSVASTSQLAPASGSQYPQRPAFHPAFSRLRSISTQTTPRNRDVSSSTYNTALEFPFVAGSSPQRPGFPGTSGSASGSAFDNVSRRSSVSNIFDLPSGSELPIGTSVSGASSTGPKENVKPPARTVKWSPLKRVSSRAFPNATATAGAAALSQAEQIAKSAMGQPTVMAVNGLIAIGTTRGWVLVFDFGQNLRCVCGTEAIATECGAVTALAVSQDHTFVAVGHENGSIHLYALIKPSQPARSVPPVTLPQVLSGRKEGHLVGSKICRLGFVGERHTAIVSSDDQGLAFYHSLGKVLMLASTDIIRMLGKYPDPAVALANSATGNPATQRPPLASAMTAPPRASIASPPESRPDSPLDSSTRNRLRETNGTNFPRPAQVPVPIGKKPTVVLDMAPLPLGPAPHPASDTLSLVALLTPTKLVVVGLKPTPRTWWRFALPRAEPPSDGTQEDKDAERGYALSGVLAWWPSATKKSDNSEEGKQPNGNADKKAAPAVGEDPLLAWAWGKTIRLARVRSKAGEAPPVPVRRSAPNPLKPPPPPTGIEVETVGEILSDGPILALRWYNERIILVLTPSHLDVFDVTSRQRIGRDPYDVRNMVSSAVFCSAFEAFAPAEQTQSYATSSGVYKRKLFMLRESDIRAGAILTWADRVLELMQPATILEAIEVATAYYEGQVDASTITLPDDSEARKALLEPRLREILNASLDFVFSDDRLRDGSHADGETIQRLFEGLVAVSVRACLALDDADWLFDELYERYEQNGIEGIFLDRLEPFVLAGTVHALPPSVTQRLIGIHAERGQFAAAERIILNVNPSNLDLNQALQLCQRVPLYDGLIHVYSRALGDWVGPLVELIGVVRRIVEHRQQRPRRIGEDVESHVDSWSHDGDSSQNDVEANGDLWRSVTHADQEIESLVPSAYKLFGYLSRALLGLAYPSGQQLGEKEAQRARDTIYAFLFAESAQRWPPPKGSLIRTITESLQEEPAFPYVRLLLHFDAEALLDTLDQASEDSYLDDDSNESHPRTRMTRQRVVDILLGLAADESADPERLSPVDLTFVRIFVARNLPKYPQFVHLPLATSRSLLVHLATDLDQSTLEDRQLATEYLLSSYTPSDVNTLIPLFERAGFLRILRSIYRGERRWADLATTYLRDDEIGSDVFQQLGETLRLSSRAAPSEKLRLAETILDAAPSLAQADESALPRLVELVDTYLPTRHADFLDKLSSTPWREFAYLRCLLEPASPPAPSDAKPDQELERRYVRLLCRNDPRHVIRYLASKPKDLVADEDLLRICEAEGSYDALVWAIDKGGKPAAALEKAADALESRADLLVEHILSESHGDLEAAEAMPGRATQVAVEQITAIAAAATEVCVSRSSGRRRATDVSPEELWFQLLASLVSTVRSIRSAVPTARQEPSAGTRRASNASLVINGEVAPAFSSQASELLSSIIPASLSALVSSASSREVSFPRLVRRLIESNSHSSTATRSYAEFKSIVSSMLDTYAFEGDLLDLASVVSAQDLYQYVETYRQERERGWRPRNTSSPGCCSDCLQPLFATGDSARSPAMSRSASATLLVEAMGSTDRPRMQKRPSLKGKEVDWPGLAPPSRDLNASALAAEGLSRSVVVGRDGRLWHLACHIGRADRGE